MKISLIRHGQTEFNVGKPRFRGTFDVPLSKEGIRQSESVGKYLQETKYDVIYYSSLSRTKATAEKIKKYQGSAEFIEEPLLFDISFGNWQGKLVEEVFDTTEKRERWYSKPTSFNAPNGENFYVILGRIHDLFERLKSQKEERVCLVTHRAILHLMMIYIFKIDPDNFWNFRFGNASVTELEILPDGRIKLLQLNYDQFINGTEESEE